MESCSVYHSGPSVNYYYHHPHLGNSSGDHCTAIPPQGPSHHHPHHHTVTLNHWKQPISPPMQSREPSMCVAGPSHVYSDSPAVYDGNGCFTEIPMIYPVEPKEHYTSHYPEEKYVSRATAEMLLSLKQMNFPDDHRHYNHPNYNHTQFEQHPDDFPGHHYAPQPVSVNFQMTMSCVSGVASVPNPYSRASSNLPVPLLQKSYSHDNCRRKHSAAQIMGPRQLACDFMGPAEEKVNICGICRKSYARPSTLKTHMRTHSGEKPYTCNLCPKTFTQAANLTAHMRTHSGEKPFLCPICARRFSQSSSVTTHIRTHSGERPYRCRVCKKSFSDSSTLTKHIRIHSGEKPYQCRLCLLRFSQSGNLNRHMKVHLVERNG